MPRCFVIQRFDGGGPYDKRYRDILQPAIKDAGLEAYRVDEDPSASVPIDDIERQIKESEICLADITLDNANIWYEVGYAFANDKPVVMICAKPRPTKTPFDIQHRLIIYYTLESMSDFARLQKEITERLKAQLEKKKAAAIQTVASLSPVKTKGNPTPYEVKAMVIITEGRLESGYGTTTHAVQQQMREAGFTDVETNLSLESLSRKGFIEYKEVRYTDHDWYHVYDVTAEGLEWMRKNQDRFQLVKEVLEHPDIDDIRDDEDIPF